MIDEVRISDIARSADWVKATHDTIRPESGFASCEVPNDWTKYTQRFSVTFPGAPENETLTDFPVLVRLSENNPVGFHYADCQKAQGSDLRFCVAGGNPLPCEVEQWNTNAESLVWVKVPTLTRGTHLSAYYGWNLAPSVDSTQVWDSHFLGVWHMGSAAGETEQKDSTAGNTTLQESTSNPGGVAAGATGIAGLAMQSNVRSDHKGAYAVNDGNDKFARTSAMTIEVWAYQDEHDYGTDSGSNNHRYIVTRSHSSRTSWALYEPNTGKSFSSSFSVTNSTTGGARTTKYPSASMGTAEENTVRAYWNHAALVFNGTAGTLEYFLNGTRPSNTSSLISDNGLKGEIWNAEYPNRTPYFYVGNNRPDTATPFPGQIDEVRISDTARSAAWIKATHDTIRPGTGFATLSAAEKNASAFVVILR